MGSQYRTRVAYPYAYDQSAFISRFPMVHTSYAVRFIVVVVPTLDMHYHGYSRLLGIYQFLEVAPD